MSDVDVAKPLFIADINLRINLYNLRINLYNAIIELPFNFSK